MKILFVSKELNLTSGSGVGARMHRDTLSKLVGNENIYVIDLDLNKQPMKCKNYIAYGKYKNKFERIKRNIQQNTCFLSNEIISEVCKIISDEQIEFVFLDDSTFGRMATKIKKIYPKVFVVSFFHDVKAQLYPIWMEKSRVHEKIDMMIGLVNEKENTKAVDKNIVLNLAEDDLLGRYYDTKADYYLPVCVNEPQEAKNNPYPENGKKRILFVGTLYTPNINGVCWFYNNVFFKISKEYDLWVVGKGLDSVKWEFQDDIAFHTKGFVESLADYYEYADVVIAPLFDGGGMKIKTAEAISFGKTFVGSSESLHGYYEEIPEIAKNHIVFQCDTAEEYLKAFSQISKYGVERKNKILVQLYNEKYSPVAAFNIVKQILEETVGKKI